MRDAGDALIFIPTLAAGGAERVTSTLANEWCKSRRVTLVTQFDRPDFYPLDPRVDVIRLGFTPSRPLLPRVVDIASAARALRKAVTKARPDFVLAMLQNYNELALAALAGTGLPVIVSERGSPQNRERPVRLLARDLLYPNAAGVIFQTRVSQDHLSARLRLKRSVVIPNPVRPVIAPEERVAERLILTAARQVEGKGLDQLLNAFAGMKTPGWRLVLCGDGPLRPSLEAQAQDLGIADRVEFTGTVKDLAPWYRRAGIFAFSSLHEGFPNALAEAVVSGLPCVSYDCPTGPSELIEDGVSGRLVPVGDWQALRDALDDLASDEAKAERYGREGARMADALHPERITAQYLAFCEEAAGLRDAA